MSWKWAHQLPRKSVHLLNFHAPLSGVNHSHRHCGSPLRNSDTSPPTAQPIAEEVEVHKKTRRAKACTD
eukprot:6048086-Amphidinium_carterae.1